jgi:hypothetical protein
VDDVNDLLMEREEIIKENEDELGRDDAERGKETLDNFEVLTGYYDDNDDDDDDDDDEDDDAKNDSENTITTEINLGTGKCVLCSDLPRTHVFVPCGSLDFL